MKDYDTPPKGAADVVPADVAAEIVGDLRQQYHATTDPGLRFEYAALIAKYLPILQRAERQQGIAPAEIAGIFRALRGLDPVTRDRVVEALAAEIGYDRVHALTPEAL